MSTPAAARRQRWRIRQRAKGACVDCVAMVEPGRIRCAWHMIQHRSEQQRFERTVKGRVAAAKRISANRNWRREARRRNLCVYCHRPVGYLSRRFCDRHAREQTLYYQRRRIIR